MTAQRHNYDDDTQADAPDAERPRKQKRNAGSSTGSWIKTLLLAGGAAVAGVIAVDFYRSKVKGEGGSKDDQQPGQPQIALPPQTFVPMPMPFPMPMPGYGGGYGAPLAAPSRRISAEEEEKMLREEMQRMLMRRKVGRDVQRAKVELLMEDLLEE